MKCPKCGNTGPLRSCHAREPGFEGCVPLVFWLVVGGWFLYSIGESANRCDAKGGILIPASRLVCAVDLKTVDFQ